MTSARGQANQKLYLARILLSAWREALAAQQLPVQVLAQAFLPAIRQHLGDAYGWFLLEVSGSDAAAQPLPRNCGDLPAPAEGKVVAGEIREFENLENTGWLATMLQADDDISLPAIRSPGNLANATPQLLGPDDAEAWLDKLAALFERMSESLDEY